MGQTKSFLLTLVSKLGGIRCLIKVPQLLPQLFHLFSLPQVKNTITSSKAAEHLQFILDTSPTWLDLRALCDRPIAHRDWFEPLPAEMQKGVAQQVLRSARKAITSQWSISQHQLTLDIHKDAKLREHLNLMVEEEDITKFNSNVRSRF